MINTTLVRRGLQAAAIASLFGIAGAGLAQQTMFPTQPALVGNEFLPLSYPSTYGPVYTTPDQLKGYVAAGGSSGATTYTGTNRYVGPIFGPSSTNGDMSYPLALTDCGSSLDFTSDTEVAVTLPATLPADCKVFVTQQGDGQITFSPSPQNAHGFTKTFGKYSGVMLRVSVNPDGSSAVWQLYGDGS